MRGIVLASLLWILSAGPVWADDNPADAVVWSQPALPAGTGYASQHAVDYPWFAECVNDFVPGTDAEIDHVHWWGIHYGTWKEDGPRLAVEKADWSGRSAGRPSLDCTGSQRVSCLADSLNGTTVGAASDVDLYNCSAWNESGPEVVYQVKIPFAGLNVSFYISNITADLDLFLLETCDENTCIDYGDAAINHTFAEPGTYYLVIDGYSGAASSYSLWIDCAGIPEVYYCVRFYEDITVRDRSMPGDVLYEYWTEDVHETYDEGLEMYAYWADIPPFSVNSGQRYWASFQCVLDFTEHGQWFWGEAQPVELMNPYMDFEFNGIPRWTSFGDPLISHSESDLAFELFADTTPVERTSWTTIKSIYR